MMDEYVRAKGFFRIVTGEAFYMLKQSFREAYGTRVWNPWYAWIVDEYMLDDYIFNYESLRDS
jgi:hypothetical protein